MLAACYRRSIAFPAISTGVYAYPPAQAAAIALATIHEHAAVPIELVRVVCFSRANLDVFEAARAELGLP